MYQIKCDDYHLYDYRLPDLIVTDPKVKIAVNTVGEASFTIYKKHPHYGKLKKLKSIFEISDIYTPLLIYFTNRYLTFLCKNSPASISRR